MQKEMFRLMINTLNRRWRPNATATTVLSNVKTVGFVFLGVFLLLGLATGQSWTSLGPTNEAGVMMGLQLHQGTNKLFGSSHDGGLWVTDLDNATPAWAPLSDYLDNIEIRAFAVAPTDSQIIYAANKSGALYRTANGGTSWTKLASFNASLGRVNKIIVPFDRVRTVFLATTTGLYRSVDSGSTWSLRRNGDVRDIAIDPSNSLFMYIGVRGSGIHKTTNGSLSWTIIRDWPYPLATDHTCCVPIRTTPSQSIKISLGERRPDGTAETSTTRTVAVKFGRHIFVSRDGGLTPFQNKDSPLISANDAGNYLRSEDYNDDDWCNAIAVDPWNSDRILVGQTGLFMTTNAGDNWTQLTQGTGAGYSHEDFQDFAFSKNVQNLIFAANDGGVERSTTANPAFSKFYTNLVTSQLFRAGVRGETVAANSDHNGLIGTTQLGAGNWSQVVSGGCGYAGNGMERSDVYKDPKRASRFYFLFSLQPDGVIFPPGQLGRFNFPYLTGTSCVNNASIFMPFRPFLDYGFPEKPQQPVAVDTRSGSQLILVASDVDRKDCNDWNTCPQGGGHTFNLMLTRNGDREPTGEYDADDPRQPTWEVTQASTDDPFVSVAFVNRSAGKNAYAITRSGALYTASIPLPAPTPIDWTRQNGFVPAGAEGVRHFVPHPASENTVYAITKNSFARTSNGGISWTVQNNPIPSSSYYSILHHTNIIGGTELYVGTSDGVYKGTFPLSGGMLWTKQNGNLPNVKVVQLVRDSIFLYAVTFGRGLWRTSLASNVGISELNPAESSVSAGEPFNLVLKWTHPERWRLLDKIDLRIIDDQGSVMLVRFDETSNTFSLFHPNAGIYGRPVQPGNPNTFQSNAATMYLQDSLVQGSGATGPDVMLTYNLSFKPPAAGRTFRIEVRASDDSGNEQGFEQVGSITVRPEQGGNEIIRTAKRLSF